MSMTVSGGEDGERPRYKQEHSSTEARRERTIVDNRADDRAQPQRNESSPPTTQIAVLVPSETVVTVDGSDDDDPERYNTATAATDLPSTDHPDSIRHTSTSSCSDGEQDGNVSLTCRIQKYKIYWLLSILVAVVIAVAIVKLMGGPKNGGESTSSKSNIETVTPTISPTTTTNGGGGVVSSQIVFAQELHGSNNRDRFGSWVIFSRDSSTMAVGAVFGHQVRVYRRYNNKLWEQIGQTLQDEKGVGTFGRCIALSQNGTIVAVGSPNDNTQDANLAGSVHVYSYNSSGIWNPVGQTLTGSNEPNARYGWYVVLSDDGRTLAVSAQLGDPASERVDAGYVRVYTYSGNLHQPDDGHWYQLGLDLEGENTSDQFGRSMVMDTTGRRLVVGANTGGNGKGRVRVYDFNAVGGTWESVGQPLYGDSAGDWHGSSVSASADATIVAIGADGDDTNGSDSGMVRVYQYNKASSMWLQMGTAILGEESGDQFGADHISMSSDGACLAIGSNHGVNNRGKGYLYVWDGSTWNEAAAVEGIWINGDHLGDSNAISGDCSWLAFGAIGKDRKEEPPGYVRIYQVS